MPPIKGQSILILGGSSGIGAATAKLACLEGVKVAIASSNSAKVGAAVEKIQAAVLDAQISGYTVDLNQYDVEDRLEKLFTEVTEANGGPLDHIIMTAGRANIKPLSEYDVELFHDLAPLRLVAPMMIGKLAPRFMKTHWTSSIIFTGGQVGEKPVKGFTVGCGLAAALYGMTRGIALDLAPIRVNAVSPGDVVTELFGPPGEARDQFIATRAASSLLGKLGRPGEVGEAYIYLMRDTNNTGTVISSSGGSLIQ